MKKHLRVACLTMVVLGLLCSLPTKGFTGPIDSQTYLKKLIESSSSPLCSETQLQPFLDNIKDELLKHANNFEKNILSPTKILCVSEGAGATTAMRIPGKILIHTHFDATLRQHIEAGFIELQFPSQKTYRLAKRYRFHFVRSIQFDNVKLESLYNYAKLSDDQRRLLSKNTLVQDQIHSSYLSALFFIVAHEMGHEILGHKKPTSNAMSIIQEKAADKWASRALVRSGIPPFLGATVSATFNSVYEPRPWQRQHPSTHPEPISRALIVLQSTKQESLQILRNKEPWKSIPNFSPEKWISATEESLVRYKKQIDDIESPNYWEEVLRSNNQKAKEEAAYVLGNSYLYGNMGNQKDYSKARFYYNQANDPISQYNYAYLLETGYGGKVDICGALNRYSLAAEDGLKVAKSRLKALGYDPNEKVYLQNKFKENCKK